MKTFRGTLVALIVLLVLVGAWYWTRPPEAPQLSKKEAKKKEQGLQLFNFEKANLVRVEVKRPDTTIVLVEHEDGWWLENENLRASRSMVNRVKHQLHDLVARATVVEGDAGALYGLGNNSIHVKLGFRDGSELEFDAGDPNPSGVSFYIRPTGTDTVYTVKKSAIDYYSLDLSEFRERRFATFEAKDVDQLEASLPGGKRLRFQRTGDDSWDLLEPQKFAASDSEVRSLLGRVSAMKAIQFVADNATDLAQYGLDNPRATITIRYSNGDPPLVLMLGKQTGENDGEYPLAYAKIGDEPHIYAIRDGLLEDYGQDIAGFRLTRFARMDQNKLDLITATFSSPDVDKDLNGAVTVKNDSSVWSWDDGVPVPGSTPSRVASRACDVESEAFIADAADDAKYGFDQPIVKVYMHSPDGNVRTILIGKKGPPGKREIPPGGPGERRAGEESYDRFYARAAEFPEVYLVDSGIIEVVKDMMREHRRKADDDAEKKARQEKIQGGQ